MIGYCKNCSDEETPYLDAVCAAMVDVLRVAGPMTLSELAGATGHGRKTIANLATHGCARHGLFACVGTTRRGGTPRNTKLYGLSA